MHWGRGGVSAEGAEGDVLARRVHGGLGQDGQAAWGQGKGKAHGACHFSGYPVPRKLSKSSPGGGFALPARGFSPALGRGFGSLLNFLNVIQGRGSGIIFVPLIALKCADGAEGDLPAGPAHGWVRQDGQARTGGSGARRVKKDTLNNPNA